MWGITHRNADLPALRVAAVTRSLTDVGPGLLVPAAWTVTLLAHLGTVSRRTLLIALGVMDVLLVVFAVAARDEMTGEVLGVWQRVLLVGLVATVAGTADLALSLTGDLLALGTLFVWMVVPGVAYVLTGRAVATTTYRRVYFGGSILSLVGAGVYALEPAGVAGEGAVVAGLALVGVGQTAGILAAVVQNG
jgi:hypothetical protein